MLESGGFGDILIVQNEVDKRICALKKIKYRGDFRDDPYIMSEIYCLTHLKHKNIISIYEVIVHDTELGIVMEFAENGNLEHFVAENSGQLEFVTKFKIYSQLLHGVEYCHDMGIAHRDLTPANILLTRDMVVKIADFGLAVRCCKDAEKPTQCADYLGRASYLAPEVLRQEPFHPQPSDIWTLAVTMLFVLFHSIPYKGIECDILKDQAREKWRDFVQEKSAEKNATLKDAVVALLVRMLELEAEARWNIHDVVRHWDDIGPESCFVE